MKRAICEKEDQISAAIRSGQKTIGPEIAAHAQHCPACSETLLVAEFLQTNVALADHERATLPDPRPIWQKARRQATQQAVRVALRPIRFMKIIAIVAFACSPWLRWLLPIGRELAASCSKAFDLNLTFVSRPWPVTANEAMLLLGLSGTILILGLSSWFMLRQE
jgi:predicted anti-sigma-YlaC factor YlaD